MSDEEKMDLVYEGLVLLRHRDLEIMTNYGTEQLNGKKAYEEIRAIEEIKREIYPLTKRSRNGKRAYDY